jgi:hypothetical protein
MLSGLNTTGHEIGGSLGSAILATIAAGAAGPTAVAGLADGIRGRVPRRRHHRRRRERRRARHPPVRTDLPAQARARPARRRPLVATMPAHHTTMPGPRRRADGELGGGRVNDADAGPALVATILGAVTAGQR